MKRKLLHRPFHRESQSGMSLLETMIALAILLVASVGIMSLAVLAMTTSEDQGHLAARTAEYAQDKMEQLMSLSYGDGDPPHLAGDGTDTTTFPSPSTGGTGLAIGGSSNPNSPVTTPGTGYVDYLDISGQPTTSTGKWFYIRVWQISTFSTHVKQITVTAKVRATVGSPGGALPQSTLVSLKSSPF